MQNKWLHLVLVCLIASTLILSLVVVRQVLLPSVQASQSWSSVDSIEQVYGTWNVEKYQYPNNTFYADIVQKEYFGIHIRENGLFGILSNCNQIGATYTYNDQSQILDATITAMTEIGCEDSFESEFVQFLTESYLKVETNGTFLRLTDRNTNIALIFHKEL